MIREVTLPEMLDAREQRAARQDALLRRYQVPLVSFTMNIAGPVKVDPLILRAFRSGCGLLDEALCSSGLTVLHRECSAPHTGCQAYYAVSAPAEALKRICTELEDHAPCGRLFDMDVLGIDGTKLERESVGGGARCCIVCGAGGRGCASRRLHSLIELKQATDTILTEGLCVSDCRRISQLATKALTDEVLTTPKPGLVDQNNNGSHSDMTVNTFLASADALSSYWAECAAVGIRTADETPEETFRLLRPIGKNAERSMLLATNDVNTHKGVIYSLGVLCAAVGRLWSAGSPCRDPMRLLKECAAIAARSVADEFAGIAASASARGLTNGQRLYLQYGLRGIRGEVADGLPAVANISLPCFEQCLQNGMSRNDAGVMALVALIAQVKDTNMIHRGGMDKALAAMAQAQALLSGQPDMEQIRALDRAFISDRLSPGGCADLLAITYFLHDWRQEA